MSSPILSLSASRRGAFVRRRKVHELLALEIQGAPEARDTALLHVSSPTLILTELVFNFAGDEPIRTELLLRVAVGGKHYPGMSRPVKARVKDVAAFQSSLVSIVEYDFDSLIVGHGEVMEFDGKQSCGRLWRWG
jgi:hypothetical protein